MRAFEFLTESKKPLKEALAMREYAHPEEYLIKDGTDAGIEILNEFKEDLEQPQQLNIKWDGKAAIFWGRDESGQFYMIPNNQWNKGQRLSKEELADEIKRTGRKSSTQSDEEFAAIRAKMAAGYTAQWSALEQSSPKQGFFWGDIMFDAPPAKNDQGQYEFTPNKVTYYADENKELGQAIKRGAKIFIAVHGLVKEFGVDPTSDLTPVSQAELSALNKSNTDAYLLSERPEQKRLEVDTGFIDKAISTLSANKSTVDNFISFTAPRFTGLKTILRDYLNARVKANGNIDFSTWVSQSKLSAPQQKLVSDYVAGNTQAMQKFLESASVLINTKDRVFSELQRSHSASMGNRLGITTSISGKPGGEGFAKIRKTGAGIKYINPEFRSAPVNPRFSA